MATYVISDVHGRMTEYKKILELINFGSDDTLYVSGDVIDRGPDGIKILQDIFTRDNVIMILGNHEKMMRSSVYLPEGHEFLYVCSIYDYDVWMSNGGRVTYQALESLPSNEKQAILKKIEELPYELTVTVGDKDFRIVHSCPSEGYKTYSYRYDDEEDYCVWNRYNQFTKFGCPEQIISGHTPVPFFTDDEVNKCCVTRIGEVINIDCGCAFDSDEIQIGRLACLRLDDLKVFYSDGDTGEIQDFRKDIWRT